MITIGPTVMQSEPGTPSAEPIPLCVPELKGNEWNYIKECLDTNWVSSVGAFVERFEKMVADYVGARHAVATVNGTAALHIGLQVAGILPDEEVLVSDLTFIAPANAIRYVGAWPVFIDAEPKYCQMDPQRVIDFLERGCIWRNRSLRNRSTGRSVKAVLPVHLLGHPVDMVPILEAAHKYELIVIEDATESLGAKYKDRFVGNLGDISCFSFNGNKIITTGGGGMVVTNHVDWAHRARYLSTQAKDDPIEYVHREIGYNYRLTNIQAAMGCAQMETLPEFIKAKQRINDRYRAVFDQLTGVSLVDAGAWAEATFWVSMLRTDSKLCNDVRELMRFLANEGIQTRPLWQPLHLSPAHREAGTSVCPVAEELNRRCLQLPSSVGLSQRDQERIIASIRAFTRNS